MNSRQSQQQTALTDALVEQPRTDKNRHSSDHPASEEPQSPDRKGSDSAEEVRRRCAQLESENRILREEIETLRAVLVPRLLTILTLRPIRYVLRLRQQMKANPPPANDDSGDPSQFDAIGPAPDQSAPPSPATICARPSVYDDYAPSEPLGIAVFAHDRRDHVELVLQSLALQGALNDTHVWIDGDQGNYGKRKIVDAVEQTARQFEVNVHRNRSNFGFRKMMIVAMHEMMQRYDRILFLEDDCFPTRNAIKGFSFELDRIVDRDDVFSIYGHPFLIPDETKPIGRFQGWGWATTAAKLAPIWSDLRTFFLMSEEEYRAYVDSKLTPEILEEIDVTPGRQPSSTLPYFFAWDETVCLLTALAGQRHQMARERLVYNFGAGDDSTHFTNLEHFRKPPFNMIGQNEVWAHY